MRRCSAEATPAERVRRGRHRGGAPAPSEDGRDVALLRALVTVLLLDAATTSVLVASSRRGRRRRSTAASSGVAVAATVSLLPGIAAVLREVRAHGSARSQPHGMRLTVVLLLAGMLVATAGALPALRSARSCSARGRAALLLVGGDLVGLPYLVIVSALHRTRRG